MEECDEENGMEEEATICFEEQFKVELQLEKHNDVELLNQGGQRKFGKIKGREMHQETHRNLYPNVVVSTQQQNGELDSDEEDYELRMHKRNDSGHGSSLTDSSVSTAHQDARRAELAGAESPQVSQGDLSSDLGEESCTGSPENHVEHDMERTSFDEHVVEALKDMQVNADEPLSRFRSGSLLNSKRTSQASSIDLDEADFTDIPLSNSVSPKGNTYAPRPLSARSPEPPDVSELHPPTVTDRKPNSRLFTKGSKASWKLFGRGPINVPSEGAVKQEIKRTAKSSPLTAHKSVVATSTTGLILENRPSHLPPKSQKEEQKHKMLYEEMIQEAKKKEVRDMQMQLKKEKQRHKEEEMICSSLRSWKEDIIPNWNTMKSSRKAKDLWWYGLPPSIRGTIWKLAIGNDLHITPELFKIFQVHYQQKMYQHKNAEPVATLHASESSLVVSKENTVGLISLDVSRTFPSLCIFQKGGPYHESLKSVLGAYTCYRPDVGYVQGMSFLAAMLLLNMEPEDAFLCFANLLNNPCQMAFFMVDQPMMEAYFCTFDVLLEESLPRLHAHFLEQKLSHDIYLIDWIFTLFSKSLPLDVACRVWDLFARDGEEFLFRTALGILSLYKEILVSMDFFHLAQYLTKLSDTIVSEQLFACIATVTFSSQKFGQILELQKKRLGLQ